MEKLLSSFLSFESVLLLTNLFLTCSSFKQLQHVLKIFYTRLFFENDFAAYEINIDDWFDLVRSQHNQNMLLTYLIDGQHKILFISAQVVGSSRMWT